jgi:IS605 OrfB family transposase
MKLVANIKLEPTPEQENMLRETLERCNQACNYLSAKAWQTQKFRQFDLHKVAYRDTREMFDLTSQAAVRCIAKVADAYKVDRKVQRTFRRFSAQPYDDRIFRFVDDNTVSIWTIAGRQKIACVTGEHQRRLLAFRKGEIDLMFVRGKWYVACVCDIDDPELIEATDVLGVDLGIVNIATDSDGTTYTGEAVERVRSHFARRRAGLQRRRTKAAKRRLRKLSGQQRRFQTHTNHVISKALVQTAQRSGRAIGLEDLTHIRKRVKARRGQRGRLHNWAFGQLRQFVQYKAQLAGVPVLLVDPRHTSKGCSCCGCIDDRNRPDQVTFSCVSCGHSDLADLNAARNIRARASVTLPSSSQTAVAA